MTTHAVTIAPETITNLVPAVANTAMVTDTSTITVKSGVDLIYLRIIVSQNDDTDVPTVQGAGTLTVTVKDVGGTNLLFTSGVLVGDFDTTAVKSVPHTYIYALPFYGELTTNNAGAIELSDGIFQVISTVATVDDYFVFSVDILTSATDPFAKLQSGPQGVTASGSEGYVGP